MDSVIIILIVLVLIVCVLLLGTSGGKYFVSYAYTTNGEYGFGNCTLTLAKAILSYEDLDRLATKIKEDDGREGMEVVILNYRKMK